MSLKLTFSLMPKSSLIAYLSYFTFEDGVISIVFEIPAGAFEAVLICSSAC